MWAGGHRRSPRNSALDAWRGEPDSVSGHRLKHREPRSRATTTRDRIKRKRHQVHAVASSIKEAAQVEDGTRRKNESINCGGQISCVVPMKGKPSTIPEKKVLEHILDTLQRRDTYEIFAEPVDPDEVVDYYEIIKEPMDFGTMRAKLQEGMYENIEQFKHDVFLITNNAMHFNSSSTIYFRQARAIHELSKRVFHVLETDPENFKSEFFGTRRRSARRAQIEAKDRGLSAEIKPIVTSNASPKDTFCSVAASALERNSSGNPRSAAVASCSNTRNNCNFFLGARDRRGSNDIETDRRCTYRRQICSFQDNDNLFDSKCFKSEPILTNEDSYRESLLLFVKELGPTAQMIASRKIQGLQENPTCHTAGSSSWVQATNYQEPAAHARNLSASHSLVAIDSATPLKFTDSIFGCHSVLEKAAGRTGLSKAEEHEEGYSKGRMCSHGASGKEMLECTEASSLPSGINVLGASRRGKLVQNHRSTEFCLGAPDASARDLNSSIASKTSTNAKSASLMVEAGRLEENVRPVILALEHSHANSFDAKLRNKKSSTPSTSFSQNRASVSHMNGSRKSFGASNQAMPATETIGATEEKKGGGSSHEERQSVLMQPIAAPIPPPVSGFTFDMHFLKAKLNQMKAVDRDKELNKQVRYQTSLAGERGLTFEQGSYSYRGIPNNSSTQSFPNKESLDTLETELALQL